jgi:hypothetical protein
VIFIKIELTVFILSSTKLIHEKNFVVIASHWDDNISISLSFDNIYYVWGEGRDGNILIPIEIKCKSFNEIIVQNCDQDLGFRKKLIGFYDIFFIKNIMKEIILN